jgi:uncharacterized protein YacL
MIIFVRIVLVLIGGAAGGLLANFLGINLLPDTSLVVRSVLIFLGIIILSGLGYVIGGAVGRTLQRFLIWLEKVVVRIPGIDLVAGVAGLIIGLIIAFLLSFGLSLIPYVGSYLAVLVFIILGYLGFFIGLRKKEDLTHLVRFGKGRTPGAGYPESKRMHVTPKIVDTSSVIDGRIADILRAGFIEGSIIIPRFVLDEVHAIADSPDSLRRNRGRRGLDVLNTLQKEKETHIEILEKDFSDIVGVDGKLVRLAKELEAPILTVDYNLNKVAKLQGVKVLNVNELANALKSIVLPGEEMRVRVVREGKEAGQGVAYLDDGTMIVVEEGKKHIGKDIDVTVTSVLQTPAGRMIFVKPKK